MQTSSLGTALALSANLEQHGAGSGCPRSCPSCQHTSAGYLVQAVKAGSREPEEML